MGGPDRGWIGSAKATDATLTNWDQRGKTVPQPKRINAGYRDPVRAFKFGEKWFQGVGCGSKEVRGRGRRKKYLLDLLNTSASALLSKRGSLRGR